MSIILKAIDSSLKWLVSVQEIQEEEELKKLNEISHLAYESRKLAIKKVLGSKIPVILAKGDDLILLRSTRVVIPYVPKEYHILKEIAHICLGIDNLFSLKESGESKYLIEAYKKGLDALNGPYSTQYQVIIETAKSVLKEPKKKGELKQLLPHIKQLISKAAHVRLIGLHEKMKQIRNQLSETEWKHLAVIVMGPQMPRSGELSMQYFNTIIGKNSSMNGCPYWRKMQVEKRPSEQRVIYAENVDDEEKALDLLLTQIVDEDIGEHILGDPEEMHQDVLAVPTSHQLKIQGVNWISELT